ncbi:DinB family protein [Bacillus vallismortis]|uniref:DinB family protein n=1 Tax=Bacillus vallismortis TaxID=72361 RepID=UPI002282752C|nr:DinB family protein [Bacillus vallismortis]MCY8533692.1 DinB family protein [Bacillus vallismortis]
MKDLCIRNDMAPTVSLLYSAVEENSLRLASIVSHMTQGELYYKGSCQTKNSTAQLLRHIANVDIRWIWRVKENRIPDHIERTYGPMTDENGQLPEPKNQPGLDELLRGHQHVVNELKSVCFTLTDDDLHRPLTYADDTATVRWGIWHMADHNRYHQAHIEALKKEWKQDRMI